MLLCFFFLSHSPHSKGQPPLLLHALKVGPSRLDAEMPRWGFKWNAHRLCSGKHGLIDNRTTAHLADRDLYQRSQRLSFVS